MNINILAKYLGLTITRVILHDVMLERLSTRLISLEYNLSAHDKYLKISKLYLKLRNV